MTSGRCEHEAFVGLISGRCSPGWLLRTGATKICTRSLMASRTRVLTDTLRRAERDGLVSRRLDSGRTDTATLYELTDLGRSLDEPLGALGRWAETHWHLVEAARRTWWARTKNLLSATCPSVGWF